MTDAIAIITRAKALAEAGGIIQGEWTRPSDRPSIPEHMCYRAALGGGPDTPCPVEVAPEWLSDLLPSLDDGLPSERVTPVAIALFDRLLLTTGWTADRWENVRVEFTAGAVEQALEHARWAQPKTPADYWPAVESACVEMAAALRARDARRITAAWAAARTAAAAEAWDSLATLLLDCIDAEIAVWLTPGERNALIAMPETLVPFKTVHGRPRVSLFGKGLLKAAGDQIMQVTPLGLAVRAVLNQESSNDD